MAYDGAMPSLILFGLHYFVFLQTKKYMNQKEAVITALQRLGGRAHLADIYRLAHPLADWSGSQDWKATLRWYLQKGADTFRSHKRGWWELISYQEELASRDARIKELETEVERLKTIPTEDDFVARFVKKVKHNLKRDKKTVEEIRKLMDTLGRSDADKELDEWLQGKHKPAVKKGPQNFVQNISNSQVFNGEITDSDFNAGGQGHE